MKTQLIMLPNQPILITDEQVNGVRAYNPESKQVEIFCSHPKYDEWGLKIIAGLPDLPQIDFSALSEEDCKKIGWVDAGNLALTYVIEESYLPVYKEECERAFINGFKTAQSLNEKKYSLEDIALAFRAGIEHGLNPKKPNTTEYCKSLSQPKVFDVQIENEWIGGVYSHEDCQVCGGDGGYKNSCVACGGHGSVITTLKEAYMKPVPTNNSIKIIKVL